MKKLIGKIFRFKKHPKRKVRRISNPEESNLEEFNLKEFNLEESNLEESNLEKSMEKFMAKENEKGPFTNPQPRKEQANSASKNISSEILDKAAENLESIAAEKERAKAKKSNPILSAIEFGISQTPVGHVARAWKRWRDAQREGQEEIERKRDTRARISDAGIGALLIAYFHVYHNLSMLTMPLFSLCNLLMVLFPHMHHKGHLVPLFVHKVQTLHGTHYVMLGMHHTFALPCSLVLTIVSYYILIRIGRVLYRVVIRTFTYVFSDN